MNNFRNQLHTWQWALLALNLIWAKWLFYPPETDLLWPSSLPIVAPPDNPGVNNELWQVPAAQPEWLSAVQHCPLFLTACCFSIFFAWLASRCPLSISLPAIVFLSAIANPDQLTATVFAGMVSVLITGNEATSRIASPVQMIASGWLITMLSIALSVDFAFTLLAFLLLLVSQLAQTGWQRRSTIMAVSLLSLVTISFWNVMPGFAAAAVRPVLAFLTALQSNVYPQLQPLLATAVGRIEMVVVLGLSTGLLVTPRRRFAKISSLETNNPTTQAKTAADAKSTAPDRVSCDDSRAGSKRLITALIFGSLAIISRHNLLPCTGVIVCLLATAGRKPTDGHQATSQFTRSWLRPTISVGLIAGLIISTISEPGWSKVTGVPRLVDLNLSGITGRVLLLQPSCNQPWDRLRRIGDVSLMADNRWDRPGLDHRQYETTCQDIMAGREDLELRPDGTVGGFRDFIQQNNVSVIAVETRQLRTLRHLATNPKWQLTALDCRQAIFETQQSSASVTRARRMGEMLLHFEWPAAGRGFNPEGILELGDKTTVPSVARALTAMHMPFAALRCVQSDLSPASDNVRREAYLELAARVRDQCGQASLADLWRALNGLDQNLSILNQFNPSKSLNNTNSQLNFPLRSQVDDPLPAEAAEQAVRQAMLTGNSDALAEYLAKVPSPTIQAFYRQISQLSLRLARPERRALTSTDLPLRLQDEGHFILANLAVESGDTQEAIALLQESLRLFKDSPFGAMRMVYLQQLSR